MTLCRLFALSAIAAVAAAAPASADLSLGSAAIYGGPAQTRAVCYFTNPRNVSVQIKSFQIAGESGALRPLAATCGASPFTLLPFRSCAIVADVPNNQAFMCRVTVINREVIRGVLEMRSSNSSVLSSQPLR